MVRSFDLKLDRCVILRHNNSYLYLTEDQEPHPHYHILLHHFHLSLSKEATLHLDISSEGSFSHKTISERKAILEKILENTPYTGVFDEFPKEKGEVELSPDQQEEAYVTESEIPSNSSDDLVAKELPIGGTQHSLEDDEPHSSMFPFKIEEDLFEDFGNASN